MTTSHLKKQIVKAASRLNAIGGLSASSDEAHKLYEALVNYCCLPACRDVGLTHEDIINLIWEILPGFDYS